ncbi:hypothetical protein N865_03800 [Intrasporangium oryzae NRRL B-24470]|uniref:Uncharacterized protein n=1 Tax=Intrasporangium oryzae NRRL B-24470 TaxID=1386089 RepID=W9GCV9_9MICO|nr:hypothetical protein [Intrasporangium oryzae]EWT03047.1 hypothetical protein N865_03800 [Intrasporangium oryzae NRRL B-24470]
MTNPSTNEPPTTQPPNEPLTREALPEPEPIEDYYARIMAAADEDGRLPVAVAEGMPGWDIYPYEAQGLRLKPIAPLADEEPARRGEVASECWCASGPGPDDGTRVWSNGRWKLDLSPETGLPFAALLSPLEHHDLATLPTDLAAEMGQLVVAVADGVEHLPSVGRVQVAKYGDGGAHLHLFFMGRPARMLQFRGSPLIDWEENLPRIPLEVHQANAQVVAERLVVHVGGRAGTLGR